MDTPHITPKQLEILLLLYRFRFLDRIHLQQFLQHKSPRRINTWLKELTDKNIIGRKYSTSLKENTKPAVYHLATKSRLILLEKENTSEKLLKRVYREKHRSEKLISHCLLLADIFFVLTKQAKEASNTLHFFSKTDLARHYYLPYRRPDAYIALEDKNKQIKRYFLEIIDEGTPRFMIRSKVAQYIDYAESEKWQEETGHPFPKLLFVCPNETIKQFLHKHILQVLEEEALELACFLSTADQIRADSKNIIWEAVEDLEED
jgi:hypothetical protein